MKGGDSMATSDKKKQYDLQYAKDKLKRIPLDVRKEEYTNIKDHAIKQGESVNGYIKKAISQRIEKEDKTS